MLKLKVYDDLSERSEDVAETEFGPELQNTMSEMAKVMYAYRGVGISGIQVGILKKMIVVELGALSEEGYGSSLLFMVNPEITAYSQEADIAKEGCLTYPDLMTAVKRPISIRVKYKTPLGEELEQEFHGGPSRIIQHEMDHMFGVTIFNRSSNMKRRRYVSNYEKKILPNLAAS